MKVLQVIDRLEVGGAEKMFVGITNTLVEKGVEVGALLFVASSPLDKELSSKVNLHLLNRKNKYSVLSLYKVHSICKQYSIVHAHLRHVYAYIRLAQWLFNGKYKLIVHDHAGVTESIPKRYKGILKPRFFIGVNKQQTEWAINTIQVSKQSAYTLENMIFSKPNVERGSSAENKAMIVANIRRVKNIEFAIELCQQMDWSLNVYGNVIEQDYYKKLEQLSNNKIKFEQGRTDFSNVYHQHKLAIHCSREETGPLVLIEYLSAGLPFIAYQTGSAADAIAKDLPQLFMQNFNTIDWHERIREILTDQTLPAKMLAVYQSKFDPEQYINKCLSIYKSVHS